MAKLRLFYGILGCHKNVYELLVQGAVTIDLLLQLRLANMKGKKGYRRSAAERNGSPRHYQSLPKDAVPGSSSSSTQKACTHLPERYVQEEAKKCTSQNAERRIRHLKRASFEEMPNPDIGSRPYYLSTAFKHLPQATGFYFHTAHFFYCYRTAVLDADPRVEPRLARIPDWSAFQDLTMIEEQGPPGFQQWLQNQVFTGIPGRWAHFTNLAKPAYIYQRDGLPVGAVFFAQDHSSGYCEVGFSEIVITQLAISFTELAVYKWHSVLHGCELLQEFEQHK